MTAVEFVREVVAEHGDGPLRCHAFTGGRMFACWEVAGAEWTLEVGERVTVAAPSVMARPIVTTIDGDPAFRVAVLAATLACREGVTG